MMSGKRALPCLRGSASIADGQMFDSYSLTHSVLLVGSPLLSSAVPPIAATNEPASGGPSEVVNSTCFRFSSCDEEQSSDGQGEEPIAVQYVINMPYLCCAGNDLFRLQRR